VTNREQSAARARAVAKVAAAVDPVARLAVDMSLAHLDRPFDYLVPEQLAGDVVPGSRVRVRFAGKLVNAYVLGRVAESGHGGRLSFVDRSISAEPVLSPEIAVLCRAVADRWAGTLADVLRLAVPPRHASVEAAARVDPGAGVPLVTGVPPQVRPQVWQRYLNGPQLIESLAAGNPARAIWAALPGGDWPAELAELVAARASTGAGVVVVLPDARDVALVDQALSARLGAARHAVLTADLGPALRYRRFLSISRGEVRIVVGTRAAAFAPVRDLGLVVVWDDGDDLHAEPRAPYPHARDVLVLRAHLAGAAAVVGGHAATAEAARLVDSGWARFARADRAVLRRVAPRVSGAEDDAAGRNPSPGGARLPAAAWTAARDALAADTPVLVQVPRAGYLPVLACDTCRAPVRCAFCRGPVVGSRASAAPSCRWCGRIAVTSSGPGVPAWRCSNCGGSRFRAVVVGASRTAEELGKGFPGVPVRTSAQGQVLGQVPPGRSLVVATPGAEPVVDGGYGAALLLDGWALLSRTDLRAGEEAVRRWLNAAAMVRPAGDGGRVVILADPGLGPVQAVIRWDPIAHAEHELTERVTLELPPAVAVAELLGDAGAVEDLLATTALPSSAVVLGPVPTTASGPAASDRVLVRALVRAPRGDSAALARALQAGQGVRSARKATGAVRVRVDPVDIG
jgi:primosomal protein N' (replication factor Y)